MIDAPKTSEEAAVYRYGVWAGEPKGRKYLPGRCAYEVYRGWYGGQCFKNPGHGPDGLYCRVHARKVSEEEK